MADRPKSGPVKEFVLTDWLREGCEGIQQKLEHNLKHKTRHFDTTEFRTHVRNARREQLLAIRSLVDSALECVKGEEKAET
jgi:hypothetical protein